MGAVDESGFADHMSRSGLSLGADVVKGAATITSRGLPRVGGDDC